MGGGGGERERERERESKRKGNQIYKMCPLQRLCAAQPALVTADFF